MSSLTRGWACLLWIYLAFFNCTYHTYSTLLKILPLSVEALQSRSCICYLKQRSQSQSYCTTWRFTANHFVLAPSLLRLMTTVFFAAEPLFLLNRVCKFSSYLTGNTLRLRYKDHPVNVFRENNCCLLREAYETHIVCGQNSEILNVKATSTCSYHCDLEL
jgi:hypothetical protein